MNDDFMNIPSAQLMPGASHWYGAQTFGLNNEDSADDSFDLPLADMDEQEQAPRGGWADGFEAPMPPR